MASLLHLHESLLPREPLRKFRRERPLNDFVFSDNPPFLSHFPIPLTLNPKTKAIFVLGSSGTGKSKLAISLAHRFDGEVINSDKMQVYDGLPIITNKVTAQECAGVPHHLLGGVHPDADFTASEFSGLAVAAMEDIVARGRLPIIAGGSNSYIKELVGVDNGRRFECCFIWVDVDPPVLDEFVAERVDKMVEQGLVEEARGVFDPEADYTRGVRRSIGLPEMDLYFRWEERVDEAGRGAMLAIAFDAIKDNTCRLTRVQREKIRRFEEVDGWRLHRVDATPAMMRRNRATGERVWEDTVVVPCIETTRRFIEGPGFLSRCGGAVAGGDGAGAVPAILGAMK
ncbi:hypothetical protein KSP39_PZI007407 [Platanthera zijinensis]|uniref:adenylate dimethylallyltransferase (ADP/ATP-dependent) n=1 Tax=Platanthera zijinensis TaxID=2320716 RepID=A0AAP0G983_9ASPA